VKSLLIAGAFVMLGVWLSPPAAAHHSMTGFDKKNTVKLEGVVKVFNWQNPHCYIEIDVPGKDGKTVTWNVEMTAPGYLIRAGWKKTAIKSGDKVTVLANPMLNGEPGALFVSVTLPDGETLSQRGVEPAAKQK
jgi:hypothetical protein